MRYLGIVEKRHGGQIIKEMQLSTGVIFNRAGKAGRP